MGLFPHEDIFLPFGAKPYFKYLEKILSRGQNRSHVHKMEAIESS
jgi:hypothetical protein